MANRFRDINKPKSAPDAVIVAEKPELETDFNRLSDDQNVLIDEIRQLGRKTLESTFLLGMRLHKLRQLVKQKDSQFYKYIQENLNFGRTTVYNYILFYEQYRSQPDEIKTLESSPTEEIKRIRKVKKDEREKANPQKSVPTAKNKADINETVKKIILGQYHELARYIQGTDSTLYTKGAEALMKEINYLYAAVKDLKTQAKKLFV